MKAAILEKTADLKENQHPLRIVELPEPETADGDILVKVSACGVCHTELNEIEGRTPPSFFPIILGHQIIGTVAKRGKRARQFELGERVGIGWIYRACGRCAFCLSGHENLCGDFKATGRDAHGGYAEYMAVNENFAFTVPETFSDVQAAPLLCAGAIGYRSLRLSNLQDGQRLGLTGFGASGHLVMKMAGRLYPGVRTFVFARSGHERNFALELGAVWAGDTQEEPPEKLHAIIDTTPVWKPVVSSLKNLEPGGRLVINAIRKEETDKDSLLRLDYSRDVWLEKEIKSVANVARRDIQEILALAGDIPILPEVNEYALEDANRALLEVKAGRIRGAKVLKIH